MKFSTRDVISACEARFLLGDPHATFEGVSIDTRTLHPGDLFFAIPGPRYDGHDYLKEAVSRGAMGVVVERLDPTLAFKPNQSPVILEVKNSIEALQNWGRFRSRRSTAIFFAITGSNGKTTTKQMLASIAKRAGKTVATRGNLNNHLGVPLMLSELREDDRFVVLEMGASRGGDIALLCDIAKPDIGVITNIGKAHLEGMQSPDGVLKVKRAVFDSLRVGGTAIVNLDDPLLGALVGKLRCRQITFGVAPTADVRAEMIRESEAGLFQFRLVIAGKSSPVQLHLPGKFQILNALAASAAAHAAGIAFTDIVAGLESFVPVAMRMQVIQHPSGTTLINDAYNANPSSVRTAVDSFCQSYAGRPHWFVFGDMRELGGQAQREHEDLGRWLASQKLDRIVLYGRDSRFVASGIGARSSVVRFKKKRQLCAELQKSVGAKPVILFKGSRVMKMEDLLAAFTTAPSTPMAAH